MGFLASDRPTIEPWEFIEIRRISLQFRCDDRQDLQAELASQLWLLKLHPPSGVRNWKAYLRRFLHNKALNTLRARRIRSKGLHNQTAEFANDEREGVWNEPTAPSSDTDLILDVAAARKALPPKLRKVLDVLEKEGFNQISVAKRMGVHRNTLGAWLKAIRSTFARFGFEALCSPSLLCAGKNVLPESRIGFVRLPNDLLEELLTRRLTAVQLRLIFWVLRNTVGWNRAVTTFSWYRIAKGTGLDRTGLLRAGRTLQSANILTIDREKIGLVLDPRQWKPEAAIDHSVSMDMHEAIHPKMKMEEAAHLTSRPPSSSDRRLKDSRDRKTETHSYHPAGAAQPVKGKYGHLRGD